MSRVNDLLTNLELGTLGDFSYLEAYSMVEALVDPENNPHVKQDEVMWRKFATVSQTQNATLRKLADDVWAEDWQDIDSVTKQRKYHHSSGLKCGRASITAARPVSRAHS